MKITFDPVKNERNIRERALSFELAAEFDFETATVEADARRAYGEARYIALGGLTADCTSCVSWKQPTAFVSSVFAKRMIER